MRYIRRENVYLDANYMNTPDYYGPFVKACLEIEAISGRPLTLAEKLMYAHLCDRKTLPRRGEFAFFSPDRVAMQDATAQMAVLQFMNSGRDRAAVPTSIHCDHLICARAGYEQDLPRACRENEEVYGFLEQAAARYGMDFWKPGAGIIHQIVLENYAFPGGMMIGTDSHTPNAGGMGMIAVGVGGSDAVDVMTGMEWELRMPNVIGVRLTGRLSGWASAKDVILKLAGILTTKGGTNSVIEYFGEGCGSISCTGKATICNMGAEVGATCSVFPFDSNMAEYLSATGRPDVARAASSAGSCLAADGEVYLHPEKYYDRVIEINLSELEPQVNGPFTPDASCDLSLAPARIREAGYPEVVEVALIGSCTNSSYQDLARAASVAKSALDKGMKPAARLIVNPGSGRIKATAERDGILDILRKAGAVVMTNACGPCIGQWDRGDSDKTRPNSIVTSFNRNFAKRADGNPNTHAFIVSPEIAVAFAFSGRFAIPEGLDAPSGDVLPVQGFAAGDSGLISSERLSREDPHIDPASDRLQKLAPFDEWDGEDFDGLGLLIKVKGKCTTDHISMAGPWLKYRGHLQNISDNLLLGAVDAFTGRTGPVAPRAKELGRSIVVAEENYGEGSSREHAAMEPRFLGVKVVLAKSFARIHETNLKKQGVLALTFENPSDYDKILEGDVIDVKCASIVPNSKIIVYLNHADGTGEKIIAAHSYNSKQLEWFRAGSALNSLCRK